jgi:SulP family sulfate permease
MTERRAAGLTAPVSRWLRSVRPERRYLKEDVLAGLPGAIGSVPDGMASAVLVGVNPVYGLYASMAGPVAGGLAVSTRLMLIAPTTASALAAGSTLGGVSAADKPEALFLLALLAGVAMIAAGLLRLGRYVRFVSHSVMIGFLTGVAVNIVCSQLSDLTGAPASGPIPLAKAIDVITNPSNIVPASLFTGITAIVLMLGLARTSLGIVAAMIALIVPTLIVGVFGLDEVARVSDAGPIPRGVPLPALPDLGLLTPSLIAGALAIAAIVLVQGAGVAESVPNPDGSQSDANQDFIAQGVGNVTSGLFKGQPVGGSVGQTALNRASGARTRWAAIASGIWMVLILVFFSPLVAKVAMPTLAAVLICAGITSLRFGNMATIFRTGRISQVAMTTTFLATLFLPVTAAVGIGVAISLLLQLNQEALDLRVVQLVRTLDGHFEEQEAPVRPASDAVTLLDVYGSLYYAGSRTLQARLPDPTGTHRPAIVLRLRGRTALGSTFVVVVKDYAMRVADAGGRLFLSGVDRELVDQLHRTGVDDVVVRARIFEATAIVGASSDAAYRAAEEWLAARREQSGEV